ncbi:SUKH-3 domain-containing protein [Streptomyces sp. NPDC005808]|uniref:SUKH-3 domain-containing protein n=1 Tax=Streptomyces sp. NPDC005808 TaxID=3364734 RepID=UPI0036AB9ECB
MSGGQPQRWSAETDRVLRKAGWYLGRSMPTGTWEFILRERGGFGIHESARRFLAEFGGLMTYGLPADSTLTQSAIRLDPLKAEWDEEAFARLSEEAGTPLCPVGQADNGNSYLGMAASGAVYVARERAELLAETADQALDRLVASQRVEAEIWKPSKPDIPAGVRSFWNRITAVAGGDADRRWPADTDRVLRTAGWYPGRSVPTETWEGILRRHGEFEMHDAAQRFLAEFGCVGIPYREPWESMPWGEFRLDPLLALWEDEVLEDLSDQAGTYLYPIGMIDRCNQHLGIAENGAVYVGMDSVMPLAATPDEALVKLTRRIR